MAEPTIGDVAFYSPDMSDPVDRLIIACQEAAGYDSKYVHVELFVSSRYLVGAVEPVVRVGPLGLLAPAAVVSPPWPDATAAERAADYAVSQIGTVYNAPGAVLLGATMFVPAWKQLLSLGSAPFNAHLLFCSQLVVNALLAGGLTPPDAAASSSPAALAAWLGAVG